MKDIFEVIWEIPSSQPNPSFVWNYLHVGKTQEKSKWANYYKGDLCSNQFTEALDVISLNSTEQPEQITEGKDSAWEISG